MTGSSTKDLERPEKLSCDYRGEGCNREHPRERIQIDGSYLNITGPIDEKTMKMVLKKRMVELYDLALEFCPMLEIFSIRFHCGEEEKARYSLYGHISIKDDEDKLFQIAMDIPSDDPVDVPNGCSLPLFGFTPSLWPDRGSRCSISICLMGHRLDCSEKISRELIKEDLIRIPDEEEQCYPYRQKKLVYGADGHHYSTISYSIVPYAIAVELEVKFVPVEDVEEDDVICMVGHLGVFWSEFVEDMASDNRLEELDDYRIVLIHDSGHGCDLLVAPNVPIPTSRRHLVVPLDSPLLFSVDIRTHWGKKYSGRLDFYVHPYEEYFTDAILGDFYNLQIRLKNLLFNT